MKNLRLFFIISSITCLPFIINSQVGIGTTLPNAQLDIRSSNQLAPSNIDGILIPKIDEFPIINPTINQDGLLVFVSGSGSVVKGFYYWENSSSSWLGISTNSVKEINDLLDGKSDSDGTNDGSSVFLGVLSGANDYSTDNKNVGVGYNTLLNNTFGNSNIAIGYLALLNNFNGTGNAAVGFRSLENNIAGHGNVGLGSFSLHENVNGQSNTALGHAAMSHGGIGGFNVAVGRNSGDGENGTSNVFLGAFSGFRPAYINRTGCVFIGTNSGFLETNSNRLHIDNSISNSPLIGGDFSNRLVGVDRDINQLTNTFEVNGTASKSTAGGWLANSDSRLKKDIISIKGNEALDKISKLSGVSYKWNDTKTGIKRPKKIQYGFVAQELMKVFPENVTQDNFGYYQTAYGNYDAFFVEAIKELKQLLELKDKKITDLEIQMENYKNLEKRIEVLERK